ncbi:hypothetical protein H8959_014403 [Pygathrix nigripes]
MQARTLIHSSVPIMKHKICICFCLSCRWNRFGVEAGRWRWSLRWQSGGEIPGTVGNCV